MTDLERLGGKGANLVWMRDADLPVPPFVVLDTSEYRKFVAAHDLAPTIADALAHEPGEASDLIARAFERPLPPEQRQRILDQIGALADAPVAVRSSATAEDLPDASFAGQQDTFLNVEGADAICSAVVRCWASLWTERAIVYRRRGQIAPESVALAVVVQQMVNADASGVLFTADPLTGLRSRIVVDAVAGLGEALVSGQVTPSHYEVDVDSSTTGAVDAGPLTPSHLTELVALGRRVAELAGSPQDIEWTRTGDAFQVVQSRAITSLFPLPAGTRQSDIWFSVGAFQGVLAPLTPLGADALRTLGAGLARVFGRHAHRDNPYVGYAGERLWVRLDALTATPIGPRLVPMMLRAAEPNSGVVLQRLLDERSTQPDHAQAKKSRAGLVHFARLVAPVLAPIAPRAARAVVDPAALRARLDANTDRLVDGVRRDLALANRSPEAPRRLAIRLDALDRFGDRAFAVLIPSFAPIMGPALGLLTHLRSLAAKTGLPDADALALTVLRSVPGNVTTDMDLTLWHTTQQIAVDPLARSVVADSTPTELADAYAAGGLPAGARGPMLDFLDRYGMRGVAEIDLGTPRWREDTVGVWTTVKAYLDTPPDTAPDRLYADGRRAALDAVERLAEASTPANARQIRALAPRIRNLIGARETPKFTFIRGLDLLRAALLESGADLVAAGVLDEAGDVVFLHLDELASAFTAGDLRPIVAERKATRAREERRGRVPLVMAGDGRTFYDAGTSGDADLAGMGVSPGVVEGRACVVDDPRTSTLEPGDILVCRGTDPAWTPLFLTAAGLVTEVGGLMTHGSVVAREYGLPAIVGVPGATEVLRDGRRIRLDGSAGTITFLDAE